MAVTTTSEQGYKCEMLPNFLTNPDPQLYKRGKYVVLDFETTNEEYGTALNGDNKIVLACWAVGEAGAISSTHYIFGGEYDMGPLLEALDVAEFIVCQNAKFELQWLERCGYDIGSRPVYDTFLAEWVITGNQGIGKLDLDSLCQKYKYKLKSKIIKLLLKGGVSPALIPRSLLLRYCLGDVMGTHHVFIEQLSAMEGTRLLPIVYTRCLTTLALADIEKNGICLDRNRVLDEYNRIEQEYAEVTRALDALTGGVNMNSPKQKAEYIYETLGFDELIDERTGEPIRTASGNPKTDKTTIDALEAKTEKQKEFKELKLRQGKLGAALSKTLDFCKGVVEERDGIFFGELRQGTTRTHRLSSAGRALKFKQYPKEKACQFQNYPNEYKKLITARHRDWLVAEADGAQLEFRVAGHLGRDAQIIHDILHKEDIHAHTRDVLVAAREPELLAAAQKDRRRLSKKHTFRPMYGGTSGSEAVQAYCKFFADKYHELHETQEGWALAAAEQGYIETEWGMRYYFPGVKVSKYGHIIGKQKVYNYPVQAFATAEIIPIGLVFFWFRTRNADLIITNTIHDSVTCEVPPYEIELFEQSAVQSFGTDVYEYIWKVYGVRMTVPLGVGMKFGTHWSESAYTDEELNDLVAPIKALGYEPIIDDGEVAVDVPIPEYA